MGFVKSHRVGTGMHFESLNGTIDLIVREIQGTTSARTVRLEVRGIPDLTEILVSKKTGDILLNGVIEIGIPPRSKGSRNIIGIYYHAPQEYDLQYRQYD